MFDSCELRIHPTGKAIARFGTKSQGQGTKQPTPRSLLRNWEFLLLISRSRRVTPIRLRMDWEPTPVGVPDCRSCGCKSGTQGPDKARKIAAHLLEVSEEDLEWEVGKFYVKGSPEQSKTIQDIAFAAYTNHPQGLEAGLEATHYYDPPNLTFPFGSYICVVDIDPKTAEIKVRRFVAIDDCGNIINPMIVEGQIHGGLTQGLAPAMYEELIYDEDGNILNGNFMDYLLPTAVDSKLGDR